MITKVNHKVSTTGWETDLEAIMTVRMKEVWKTSGKELEAGLQDYLELFKITNVTDYDGRFDEQIAAENIALGDANEKANEAAQLLKQTKDSSMLQVSPLDRIGVEIHLVADK